MLAAARWACSDTTEQPIQEQTPFLIARKSMNRWCELRVLQIALMVGRYGLKIKSKAELMDRLLLRASEVAVMIGLGKSKTYALIAAGEIPSVRLSKGAIRVSADALRRWTDDLQGEKQPSKSGAKTVDSSELAQSSRRL